jgi:hypothetical protein
MRAASKWKPTTYRVPVRESVLVYHEAHWMRLATLHESGDWFAWPSGEPLSYKPTHFAHVNEPNEKNVYAGSAAVVES